MRNSARKLFLILLTGVAFAAAPNQFVARYVPIGASGSAALIAADASGNFFIVASVTEPSGRPQIRAIKADPQGNEIASLDFGGSSGDIPSGAVADTQGNLVIVGTTYSPDFPLVSPLISATNTQAGFVVKLNSQLTAILFSTRLGATQGPSPGYGGTSANAVALDTAGNIYVAGSTAATDFPVTPGAFQTVGPTAANLGSPVYAFVTEISPDGSSIVYSTFYGSPTANCMGDSGCLGTVGATGANAIAIDSTGAVVIAGGTSATQLPGTGGGVGPECGCYINQGFFSSSSFLVKFEAGWKLAFATYIVLAPTASEFQSSASITITSVAVDSQGNVVFGGSAADGLVLAKALQTSYPSGTPPPGQSTAGFVAKVNSSATSYLFSTYFGGNISFGSPTGVSALALDAQGDIWLTGASEPGVLPVPASFPLFGSTYVAELSADGSSVLGGITAPAGGMGQSLVLTSTGVPAVLGPAGSLVLNLPAQPASLVGVANSAGIQVSGNVAPYELVSLYGVGLGPANALEGQVVKGVLTSSLGGVQVLFNNVAAPLLYVGPSQINAIVPSSVSGQNTATVQIVTPDGTLTGPVLSVVPSEPEVFQSGPPMPQGGAAIALNQDGSLNSASNPAASESIVTIWATGTGENSSIDDQDGVVASDYYAPALPVSVLNSGHINTDGVYALEVLYAGNAPGLVTGVVQVNFRLPPINSSYGGQITCQLQVGGAVSSRFAVYVKP